MFMFTLVQHLRNSRVVAQRNREESDAIRGIRSDFMQAWMFREDQNGQLPAEVLYMIDPSGIKVVEPPIEYVPEHILNMLSPRILVQ